MDDEENSYVRLTIFSLFKLEFNPDQNIATITKLQFEIDNQFAFNEFLSSSAMAFIKKDFVILVGGNYSVGKKVYQNDKQLAFNLSSRKAKFLSCPDFLVGKMKTYGASCHSFNHHTVIILGN